MRGPGQAQCRDRLGEGHVQVRADVVQFAEVGDRADVGLLAAHPYACGLDAGHLHGPVPQDHRGGVPVEARPHIRMGAAHREDAAQTRCGGQDDQPQAQGRGDSGAHQDPDVVQGALGELPGEFAAPVHGRPVGPDGCDVVQEDPRDEQEQQGHDARRDPARRPETAFAAARPVLQGGWWSVRRRRRGLVAQVRCLLDDRQSLCSALGALGLAHRVLPCATPCACAGYSRSTWTATSDTSMPTNATTRSTTC